MAGRRHLDPDRRLARGVPLTIDDSSDAVREYLRIAEAVPPLDPDAERALAVASRGGDQVARKKLIEASLRLVIPIARQYEGRGVALLDLLQEGNLGVVRAVEKFDPESNLAFSELAKQYIEQAVAAAVG
jgi:RNA polymerase primary sigma factor